MKYLQVKRKGFRQYECTNENGNVVKSGIGETSYFAIINCLEAEFNGAFKFEAEKSKPDAEFSNRIVVFALNGEYYLIDKEEPDGKKHKIKLGDYVAMDCSKNIFIVQLNMRPTIQHVRV